MAYPYNRLKNIFGGNDDGSSYDDQSSPDFGSDNYMQDQPDDFGSDNDPSGYVMDPRAPERSGYRRTVPNSTPQSMEDALKQQFEIINKLNTPSTQSSNRLNNLLDNFPRRNAPSLGKSLIAATMTFGDPKEGYKRGQEFMYAPYARDLADWKERVGPYQQAATLENNQNVNERNLTTNMLNNYTGLQKIDAQEREQRERNRVTDEKNAAAADVAKTRGDAYAFKQYHPDWKFDFKGPEVIAVSPDGTQRATLGKTGHLSDADKINLETQQKLAVAQQQGVNSANTARIRESALIQDKDGNQYYYDGTASDPKPVGGAPPFNRGEQYYRVSGQGSTGSGGPKTNTLEQMRIEQDRMKDLFELTPEARKFITKDSMGKFSLKNRPVASEGGFLGYGAVSQDDVNTWDTLKHEIDPSYTPPVSTQPQNQPPQTPPMNVAPNTPAPNSARPPIVNPPTSRGQRQSGLPPTQYPPDFIGPKPEVTPGSNTPWFVNAAKEMNKPYTGPHIPNVYSSQEELDAYTGLQQRATDALRSAGKPVTPGNIQYMIQSGQVQ